MKLNEFFGNIDYSKDAGQADHGEDQKLGDQVFWYIIDHDDLHKRHFLPAANTISKTHKDKGMHDWKIWDKLVKEGCLEYYKHHKLEKDPKDIFHKEFREDLCKRLAEHYHNDIIKGEYNLGH